MGPLGLEPTGDFDGTGDTGCACVNSNDGRAAPALHSEVVKRLELASLDADLLAVVLAWERISDPIRKGICALVEAAVPTERDET